MSSTCTGLRRRSALAATAVVAALAVTATACGPGDDADAKPDASASEAADGAGGADKNGDDLDISLPKDLPTSLQDLEKWKNGGWEDWNKKDWLREAADFANPYIKDLWDADRMKEALERNKEVSEKDLQTSAGESDPAPTSVRAKPVKTPYHKNAAPVGKVFFDTPKGSMVCSGTVVKDPRNPGKSNLVATAGHCVHGGKTEGWFRNIMFVPSYNDNGYKASDVAKAPPRQVTPYGKFWAKWAQTTSYWIERGNATRGAEGASQDFAVMQVQAENGSGKSLEETVGNALKINFNAPQPGQVSGLSSFGYPAAPPYDGAQMLTCTDRPGKLTVDPSQPAMYRYGCTMTGGSSGGPALISGSGGKAEIVSVNSIGPADHTWLAGPYLGDTAKGVFDAISKKYAGKN